MMVMKVATIKMKLLVLVLAAQLLKVNSNEDIDEEAIEEVFVELNRRIQEVKKFCSMQVSAVKQVAFSAVLHPPKTSGLGIIGPFSDIANLVHPHVITNTGGAYKAHTGVFTAPVKGVYFFTFTTHSWAKNADIGVALYRNQAEALRVCEHQDDGDNGDYATNSAALILEPGDTVSLRLPKGFQVAASVEFNIHTFSGFLLYQL
ncbi:complement C1q-like protein 4 [Colossoma macropomum]|uniref:complement C1q-like protein 4 n=1 Tax=Colossoma macropomum TaxID=42526 RepID=UPI0018651078|nr:complement C1q-like protein 4 [Colossoma macropomum]